MAKARATAPLGEGARSYRLLMWVLVLLAAVLGALVLASLRGMVPREAARPLLPLVFACLVAAAWLGWRGHRAALADRERMGHTTMILAIAAQLGRQEDAALERIAASGGPAGEAATWILAGRAEKRAKGG